jgi:hypothetical protein
MRGARRTLGVAPIKKSAATADKVLAMVAGGTRGLVSKRDRAIILLGFALAARRSELVALDVADLEECPEGLRVTIRRSKTDQEGAGAVVAVCRGSIACPVAAVRDWLAAAGITEGPLFRPVNKGGRLLPDRLAAHCEDLCGASGARCRCFFGAQPPLGLPDIRGRARRFAVQDGGCKPAQVGRCPARLCTRCRRFPGSRWGRIAVTTPCPLFAVDLPHSPRCQQGRM